MIEGACVFAPSIDSMVYGVNDFIGFIEFFEFVVSLDTWLFAMKESVS
jgi:hypothetical protein